ncbi:anti-sigma regulatory factor [Frankia sp. CNm7]|uniref:Anti-sigma regulatory factor n=1 Tax=Frankia nepalensis TaxID=1836974 RepID=A0A937RDX0_9ACTN|nr:ATP-binding protein [Frankia nepalensis]MBL7497883.1 anti-sigma regulatory factor [Frankia nepalensis]MBL7514380.1 anti-sigma regulatory factor [Frankia nepalensis]MBL7523319.1 anti-sigma regulatory factor [Frankia nepalensis]MBL7628462.1 anti-sigma regulatory factor [Frankia nepalensis]
MTVEQTERHPITTEADVVRVRQVVRGLAVTAKMSLVDQTKVVTAASELARNTLVYGGGGSMTVDIVHSGRRRGLRAVFVDSGPGIPDLDLALTDGWTSGSGLGLGLSGSRRLVDDFAIESSPGAGTTVRVVKWSR